MVNKIFLFRTHYSTGKGIIQANPHKENDEAKTLNLASLCLKHKISQCFVVDNDLGGIRPIYDSLESAGIPLVFGYRVSFTSCLENEDGMHKNIIFAKSQIGYEKLIDLATQASCDFFKDCPRLTYDYYHSVAGEDLVLAIPFYDSFLHRNAVYGQQCVPDFRGLKPPFFVEENELVIDKPLRRMVESYCASNGNEVIESQTVYYEKPSDILAYQARRAMHRIQGSARTLEKPEMPHFNSDKFCIIK